MFAAAYTMVNLLWLRLKQVAANRSIKRIAPLELSSWAAGSQAEAGRGESFREVETDLL